MGNSKRLAKWAWGRTGDLLTAKDVISLCGATVMGVLTWLSDQPLWLSIFVAIGAFAVILIVWTRILLIIDRNKSEKGYNNMPSGKENDPDSEIQKLPGWGSGIFVGPGAKKTTIVGGKINHPKFGITNLGDETTIHSVDINVPGKNHEDG